MSLCPVAALGLIRLSPFSRPTDAASPMVSGAPAQLIPAHHLAGDSGSGDQRDEDLIPVVAYDLLSGRCLTEWRTARGAVWPGNGLDLDGRISSADGASLSAEFRISDDNTVSRNGTPSLLPLDGGLLVACARRSSQREGIGQEAYDDGERRSPSSRSALLQASCPVSRSGGRVESCVQSNNVFSGDEFAR